MSDTNQLFALGDGIQLTPDESGALYLVAQFAESADANVRKQLLEFVENHQAELVKRIGRFMLQKNSSDTPKEEVDLAERMLAVAQDARENGPISESFSRGGAEIGIRRRSTKGLGRRQP